MGKYLKIEYTDKVLAEQPHLGDEPMFPVEQIMVEYRATADTESRVMLKIQQLDLIEETLVFRSDERFSQVEVSFFPDSYTKELPARLLQCEGVSMVRIRRN